MTVAPLRPEPIVVRPNDLKKKGISKRTIMTVVIAILVVIAAAAATYVAVRTVRRDNAIQQQLERQQPKRNRRNQI